MPAQGGGGTYDGMEPRVAALEKAVERIEPKLDRLSAEVAGLTSDIGSLKAQVAHLPTATNLVWGSAVFLIAMAAMVYGVGSYMSGTMSTALSAVQAVLAARPPEAPAPAPPTVIVIPSHVRPIAPIAPK